MMEVTRRMGKGLLVDRQSRVESLNSLVFRGSWGDGSVLYQQVKVLGFCGAIPDVYLDMKRHFSYQRHLIVLHISHSYISISAVSVRNS